jgi:hypothetical protein
MVAYPLRAGMTSPSTILNKPLIIPHVYLLWEVRYRNVCFEAS